MKIKECFEGPALDDKKQLCSYSSQTHIMLTLTYTNTMKLSFSLEISAFTFFCGVPRKTFRKKKPNAFTSEYKLRFKIDYFINLKFWWLFYSLFVVKPLESFLNHIYGHNGLKNLYLNSNQTNGQQKRKVEKQVISFISEISKNFLPFKSRLFSKNRSYRVSNVISSDFKGEG